MVSLAKYWESFSSLDEDGTKKWDHSILIGSFNSHSE